MGVDSWRACDDRRSLRENGLALREAGPSASSRGRLRRTAHAAWLTLAALLAAVSLVWAQGSPPPEITIDQLHIFLLPAGDRLRVSEYYLLGNSGDTTYSGRQNDDGELITVVFPLPEGATALRPEDDPERYVLTEHGIADTHPILPGPAAVEVRFEYELPLAAGSTIVRPLALPVQAGVLLLVGDQWQLQGQDLTSLGLMEVGGQQAQAYTFESLKAADGITFALVPATFPAAASGGTAAPVSEGKPVLELGLGVLALVGAVGASVALWRSGSASEVPASVRDDIKAIALLDERFAAEEMGAEEFAAARAALKDRVLRDLQGQAPSEGDMG